VAENVPYTLGTNENILMLFVYTARKWYKVL